MEKRIRKTLAILKKSEGETMLSSFSHLGPWKILISTILSARSKDETTIPICKKLFKKYNNARKLANAEKEDIEKIIKKTGFYRNKAKFIIETSKKVLEEYNNKVPDNIEELLKFPGVGRKVANCVLVYAFQKSAIPVDTHVHRISNRLGWVNTKDPEKTEIELIKIVPKDLWIDVNEYFVSFGKSICKPISPMHDKCPIRDYCDYYLKNSSLKD